MGLLTILKKVKEEEKELRVLVLGLDNAGKTTIVKRLCGQPIEDIEPTLGFTIHTLDYQLTTSTSTPTNTRTAAAATTTNDGDGNDDDDENKVAAATVDPVTTSTRSTTQNGSKKETEAKTTKEEDDEEVNDNDEDEDDAECYKLHLWDIGGQSTIRAYWRNYYEKTDGIIWVIDACDTVRLSLVQHELANVLQQERLAGASLLLLANKSDVTNAWTPAALADGLHLDTDVFRGQTHTRHWKLQGCSAVTTQGLLAGLDWLVQDITDRIFYTG